MKGAKTFTKKLGAISANNIAAVDILLQSRVLFDISLISLTVSVVDWKENNYWFNNQLEYIKNKTKEILGYILLFLELGPVMLSLTIKKFVVTNCKEGATRFNSNQNSKEQNFNTNKYLKRMHFYADFK